MPADSRPTRVQRRALCWPALALGAALAAALAPAHADPLVLLPNPSIANVVLFNSGQGLESATFGELTQSDGRIGTATAAASGEPLPAVRAGVSIGTGAPVSTVFGRATSTMLYSFEILGTGPTADVLLDAVINGFASTLGGATFAIAARWTLFENNARVNALAGDQFASGQQSGPFNQAISRTVDLTLLTDHAYVIELVADAAVSAPDFRAHGEASAFADPRLRFAAGFDTGTFSFVFSPGIGNGAADPPPVGSVPEPGTLALLAMPLVLATLGRRRAQGAAPARASA